MNRKTLFFFKALICALVVVLLIGCGTIMYPNRVGQRGGNIDAGVVVMDGLLVLLFVVPGVIAFIVDFSNGAIYLPGGIGSLEIKDMKKVAFDADNCGMKEIEKIVQKETGIDVVINRPGVKMYSFNSLKELKAHASLYLQDKDLVVGCR